MNSSRTYNKYDVFLIILIVLQIFGLYGGDLQPARIFVLLFIPYLLIKFSSASNRSKFRYEISFFSFFFVWSIILLCIVINLTEGIKEICYLIINFSSILLMLIFSTLAVNPKRSVIYGWFIFCLILFPLSFFEIFYGFHLTSSVIEEGTLLGGTQELAVYSTTTFGNYNYYVVMLLYAFPFVSANLFLKNNVIIKIINLFTIFFLIYIVLTNASRGGMLCVGIGLIYFLFKYIRNNKSKAQNIMMFVIVFILIAFSIKNSSTIFYTLIYRLDAIGLEDDGRLQIYSALWQVFKDSYFMGVGPGNLQIALKANSQVEIVAAHNLFLEILIQYGFFIFIGFSLFITRIYKNLKSVDNISKYILILSLFIFPISSIINSTYLQGINVWIFLASIKIMATKKILS